MTSASRCLACGSTEATPWASVVDVEYRTSDEAFQYYRCATCSALSIRPVPTDRLSEIYPPNYYSFGAASDSFIARVKAMLDRRSFASLLRELPHQNLRVLDIGGGSGTTLSLLSEVDTRVVSTHVVDIDEGAADQATARGHTYIQSRIEEWSSDLRFELILMLNLVEHVATPLDVLAKARGLLAPGGLLVIQTPNIDSLDARLFRHRNWGGYHCPRHWVLFDRASFVGLAGRAGLKVRSFRYTQGAPFWTVSVLGLLARRGWVRVDRSRPAYRHPLYAPLAGSFALVDFARRPVAKLSQMVLVLEDASTGA